MPAINNSAEDPDEVIETILSIEVPRRWIFHPPISSCLGIIDDSLEKVGANSS